MAARDGSARPIPLDRLADFEGHSQEVTPTPSLPARPRPAPRPAPSPARPGGGQGGQGGAEQTGPPPAPPAQQGPAPGEVKTPNHASNAQIPMRLMPLVVGHCKTHAISHGTLIITALEANAERLAELVTPTPTAGGGGLFPTLAASRTGPRASGEEQIVPLTFRLPRSHFEVLDQLVAATKAPSRSKLISAALAAYLDG